MSNAPIFAGIGVGTVASGVGIAVVVVKDGVKSEGSVILHSSSHFPSKYKELKCSKNLFESIVWVNPIDNSSVKTNISNKKLDKETTEGCISVWWQKETLNGNWKGIWNLVWATRDNTYGTIFISTIIAYEGKIKVDKSFYLLEKKTENQNKWTTTGHWYKDQEDLNSNNASSSIIYPSDSFKDKKNGWDFIKENEFSNVSGTVCPRNQKCNGPLLKIEQANLNWKYIKEGDSSQESTYKAHEWSKNTNVFKNGTTNVFTDNLENIYENTSGYYKLEETN